MISDRKIDILPADLGEKGNKRCGLAVKAGVVVTLCLVGALVACLTLHRPVPKQHRDATEILGTTRMATHDDTTKKPQPTPSTQCVGKWSDWLNRTCSDVCGGCGRVILTRVCESSLDCPCIGEEEVMTDELCNFSLCHVPRKTCCAPFQKGLNAEEKRFACVDFAKTTKRPRNTTPAPTTGRFELEKPH